MVLKDSIQKRIGIVFLVFSSIVLVLGIIKGFYLEGIAGIFSPRNFVTITYFFIFGFSIFHQNLVSRALQVFCVGLEGILILVSSSKDSFFGLTFILIAMLLVYVYGYFVKYKIIKAISFSGLLVYLFSKFSLNTSPTPWLSSIMWVVFIWVVLYLLWLIFKDYMDELRCQRENREKYLQESLDSLKKKVEEYSEISHISLDTNKELLEIIKNHENKEEYCD